MFSILLQNRKCKELERIEVPALRGGKGKKKYYVFVIQPEKLLRIAYVHRRESNPKDVQETYQRMISKPRLTKIQEFIEKGGFFPNNIIINFTQRPIFLQTGKTKHTGIVYGILKFPHYYGCAWVIDGQHRLYGYSKTKKKFDDTLCVLAFEGLSISEQAKLFVEINKEQKKVSSNLLWELYKDIYANSDDPKQQYLWCISCITYKLNFNKDSPLFSHIAFPSCIIKDKKLTNLTLANICDGIEENGIVKEKDSLLFHNTYSDTVDFTYERLKAFFEFLKEELKEDWECGDEGLIRTNVGVRIFLIIFRQLLKYLKYRGEEEVYLKKDLSTFKEKCKEILGPVIDKIKVMSKTGKDEIRKGSVKVKIMENTQKLVWPLRERINFGIELWKKGGWTPEVDESDESIKHFIDETEVKLREFIREKLKKVYGKEWWEKGIPDGVKEYAETKIKQEITQKFYPSEKMLSPEEKLEFISTSHYREIITKKNNWPYFTEIFSEDKEVTSASFKFFENLRNAFKHNRKLDEITKKLGYWHMRWIRRCIGLETPNIS
jgi:DGQHR domain-containing protein